MPNSYGPSDRARRRSTEPRERVAPWGQPPLASGQRAGQLVALVAVVTMLALLLGGVTAVPAAVRSSAGAVAHDASQFIHWCLVHWACSQPVEYGPIASCNPS